MSMKDWKIDEFGKNFVVYSQNPIKICAIHVYIIKLLWLRFSEIEYITSELKYYYSTLISLVLDNTEDIRHTYFMLTDKLLNNKEVIDVIAEWNLQIVMNNSNVDRVVQDFWDGPYESELWLNKSFLFAEISSLFDNNNSFLGFSKHREYWYSFLKLMHK